MNKKIIIGKPNRVLIVLLVILFLITIGIETYILFQKYDLSSGYSTDYTATTTTIETLSTPSTTTVIETTETTTENISKNLPTLKIIVYEGPVIVQDSDMCYYRVEAIVTGNPAPIIKFSKDDSNGAWGKNKAQVNLKNGESYTLVVTAVNSVGAVTKHIDLTWSQ